MVALEIIKSLFGSIWNLFTGVPIPGQATAPASPVIRKSLTKGKVMNYETCAALCLRSLPAPDHPRVCY